MMEANQVGEKLKIFREFYIIHLEKQVNNWLDEQSGKIEITRVTQSESASATTLAIFYKEISKTKTTPPPEIKIPRGAY